MFTLKKMNVFIVCLLLVVSFVIPYEIQAITTSEANKIVDKFIEAVDNHNISEMKNALQTGEDKIIEVFKACEDEDFNSNPKLWAYYFIAKFNFEIGKKGDAYNYFTNAITILNSLKNPDGHIQDVLFRNRALCSFAMRKSNDVNDANVKKAFADLNKTNDWLSFCYNGIMNTALGDKKGTDLNMLMKAKILCEDPNMKNNIQKMIDERKNNDLENFWKDVNEFLFGGHLQIFKI